MESGYTTAGSVRLGRGSPCRNSIWKVGIWDAACGIPFDDRCYTPNSRQIQKAESSGQSTSLRCSEKVTFDSPYCGEGDDVFLVCTRLRYLLRNESPITRLGYKKLEICLWRAEISKHCFHGSRMKEDIKLAVGCATVTGFGLFLEGTDERIIIFQTAHSRGARWLALATVPYAFVMGNVEDERPGSRKILLRANKYCFQYAIDQVASQTGKWFIIL